MKKTIVALTLLFTLVMSLSLGFTVNAEASLSCYVDFSTMDANAELTAEDINAYAIENVMVAVFEGSSEGNILAAKENKKPSYVVYKLSASEGSTLDTATLKSYASVYDHGDPAVGNEFGIYVNATGEFDFENDTAVVEGMVGKKNHTWDLTDAVAGQTEAYVCIYFLNNSDFVDWVRFYSFNLNATEASAADTSEVTTTEPETEESESKETTEQTEQTSDSTAETSDASDVTTGTAGGDEDKGGMNPVAVILIVAGALIVVIVVVALVMTMKKKK